MLVNTPPHPPLAVVEAKNVAHAELTSDWVLQAGTVTLFPVLNTTCDGEATVKVALTLSCEQLSEIL